MEHWPTFLIGGAPRCGTYSIYEYLNLMNSVFMCPAKEPNYFAPSIDDSKMLSNPIRNRDLYLKQFNNVKNEKAIGEASPTYLWDPLSPKFIFSIIPEVKLIFILRDPIQRSFSHYLNNLGLGYETRSFIDAMKYALSQKNDYSGRIAMASFYSSGIQKYLDIFPHDQIKFFIFEEFFKNPIHGLKEIIDFLKIDEQIPQIHDFSNNEFTLPRGKIFEKLITNKNLRSIVKNYLPKGKEKFLRKLITSKSKKPIMTENEKKFCQELFIDDVLKTEKLLKRDLPWFNKSNN